MTTKDHDLLIEIKSDMKWLKHALLGNGTKGYFRKVDENTRWRWLTLGAVLVIPPVITIIVLFLGGKV